MVLALSQETTETLRQIVSSDDSVRRHLQAATSVEEFAGILAAAARQKDIVLDKAQLAAGLDMTIRNMKNQGQDRELSDQELEGMASGGIWPMVIFTFGLMEMAVSLFPGNDGQPAGGERRG